MSTPTPAEPAALETTDDGLAGRPAEAPRRRRFDPKLALASLAIACGLALIGWGLLRSVTGDDVTKLPDAIESISPVPDAVQVPAQTEVVVDMEAGYEGTLQIDGVEFETVDISQLVDGNVETGAQVDVPTGVVVYDPGNATLRFTPAEGTAIERFGPGNHDVRVTYWPIETGPGRARDYIWTFHVV
jgi:hypothetical protein